MVGGFGGRVELSVDVDRSWCSVRVCMINGTVAWRWMLRSVLMCLQVMNALWRGGYRRKCEPRGVDDVQMETGVTLIVHSRVEATIL